MTRFQASTISTAMIFALAALPACIAEDLDDEPPPGDEAPAPGVGSQDYDLKDADKCGFPACGDAKYQANATNCDRDWNKDADFDGDKKACFGYKADLALCDSANKLNLGDGWSECLNVLFVRCADADLLKDKNKAKGWCFVSHHAGAVAGDVTDKEMCMFETKPDGPHVLACKKACSCSVKKKKTPGMKPMMSSPDPSEEEAALPVPAPGTCGECYLGEPDCEPCGAEPICVEELCDDDAEDCESDSDCLAEIELELDVAI